MCTRGVTGLLDANDGLVILDSALGTALEEEEQCSIDLHQPLWSAYYIRDHPDVIRRTHQKNYEAGADIVITSSYQATIDGFMNAFKLASEEEAKQLLIRSVHIAVEAREEVCRKMSIACFDRNSDTNRGSLTSEKDEAKAVTRNNARRCDLRVAASIGPYGATLCGGEEYRGSYGKEMSVEQLQQWHAKRFYVLVEHYGSNADILAIETIPCLSEVKALVNLLRTRPHVKAWISVSCRDSTSLRSGELISSFVKEVEQRDVFEQIQAIGANCMALTDTSDIIRLIRSLSPLRPIVVYPNRGQFYNSKTREWVEKGPCTPEEFAVLALEWRELGRPNVLIGGCCMTNSLFIRAISSALRRDTKAV